MSPFALTTADVAVLLDVHPSTAKRWCDDGALPSERTEGGHRRIRLESALQLGRERGHPSFLDVYDPYQAHVWRALSRARSKDDFEGVVELAIGWLRLSAPARIAQLFMDVLDRDIAPVARVLDRAVRGFMERVGTMWAAGQLRTGDEHVASALMLEALTRLRLDPSIRMARDRTEALPTAIVGSADTNEHHLGAASVCLMLERQGWNVIDLGARVPTADVPGLQRAQNARLVCLSFSELAAPSDAARTVQALASTYSGSSPFALAVGGNVPALGDLPTGPFLSLSAFQSLEDFAAWLPRVEAAVADLTS